jgi:hypothetical protein
MKNEEAKKKIGLFDYIQDLTFGKQYIFNPEDAGQYSNFMINRGISQNPDLIFIANEMNKASTLNKEMNHDFYFYSVKKQKRYGKWSKSEHDEELINLIKSLYEVSTNKAIEYINIMKPEQIEQLKQLSAGGKKK